MPSWAYDTVKGDTKRDKLREKIIDERRGCCGGGAPIRELKTSGKVTNQKWVIKEWPEDAFDPNKHVELITEEIDLDAPIPDGKAILQVEMLGADAFIRTMLAPGAFHGSAGPDSTLPSLGYGVVVKSGKGAPAVGTRVGGMVMAQTYATLDAAGLNPVKTYGQPPSSHLGMLGLTTGLTAYAGIFCVLKPPKKGDTVIISAAGGGVGIYASQLAKSTGAKVIGVAGGADKCAFLMEEMGLDGAIDYKSKTATILEQMDKLCPEGIDFMFDNVGGEILDAVLVRLKKTGGGRIVLCGGITKYNTKKAALNGGGPEDYLKLAERQGIMAGFVVWNYAHKFPFAIRYMIYLKWRGLLKTFETRSQGIESYPITLNGLFTGGPLKGKAMVDLVPGHDV